MSSLEQSVRFDILGLCSGSWLFNDWAVEVPLGLYSGFTFLVSESHFFTFGLWVTVSNMKLTVSKLGKRGIWRLQKPLS